MSAVPKSPNHETAGIPEGKHAPHYPGPWKPFEHNGRLIIKNSGIGGYIMADVGNSDSKIAQANAALISAAPDLLMALRTFVVQTEGVAQFDAAWRYGRDALAKAEGLQP